jgi:hypothetical protein
MAADRSARSGSSAAAHARASVRAAAAAVALAALTLAAGTAAHAASPDPSPPTVSKPARGAAEKSASAPTLSWHDGERRRTLSVDASLEADFTPRTDGGRAVLRPAGSAPKSASALVSPVLRDESGRARALPGGVLVVLAAPLGEAEGRALIERAGAAPVRRLSDRLWVVEGPVGLGSLELAERLAATGAFASAQPNWWVERTLK